ncbi:MAG: response regulator [Balneola sp.]
MKIKLLLLEDSELDVELMLRELRSMEKEFVFKVVDTLEDFEDSFLRWNPDVVISDFNLQSFSGEEALSFAKLKNPNIPVIILSGSITKNVEVTLLENRANDVLTKDNLKRLPFAIKRVLNEKADKDRLNTTLYELAGNLKFQETLAEISLRFNSAESLESKMNGALRLLGETADVSRVYVFEDFDNGRKAKNTYEWCAEGVKPQIDNLQSLDYEDDLPSIKPILIEDGVLILEDIQNLKTELKAVFEPQNIKSLIIYPISVGDEFFGCIGFDEVRRVREWNESEDKLLKSISGIIGNVFSEYASEQKLIKTNKELNKLLTEKELLVGEVHHRVKNNLALISSFLQLDQMGLGIKGQDDIISANVLRIKSIAIIHEIIYEGGTFSNIPVVKTLDRVLTESFRQEKEEEIKMVVSSSKKAIEFNINQAVPFSLLLSEMIFEVFRLKKEIGYQPSDELKIDVTQDENKININFHNAEFARVVYLLTEHNQYNFSEIFKVLSKQLGANILLSENKEILSIQFAHRDIKGAGSSLV